MNKERASPVWDIIALSVVDSHKMLRRCYQSRARSYRLALCPTTEHTQLDEGGSSNHRLVSNGRFVRFGGYVSLTRLAATTMTSLGLGMGGWYRCRTPWRAMRWRALRCGWVLERIGGWSIIRNMENCPIVRSRILRRHNEDVEQTWSWKLQLGKCLKL